MKCETCRWLGDKVSGEFDNKYICHLDPVQAWVYKTHWCSHWEPQAATNEIKMTVTSEIGREFWL